MDDVLACRSPDVQHYTIRSNGRLGRLLLDAELSADSSAKSNTKNVSQVALYYRQQIGLD